MAIVKRPRSDGSFIFAGKDCMYVAYPLSNRHLPSKVQQLAEFGFSQIFGASSVLATCATFHYLREGDTALCIAGAVLSSFCTSLFYKRIAG